MVAGNHRMVVCVCQCQTHEVITTPSSNHVPTMLWPTDYYFLTVSWSLVVHCVRITDNQWYCGEHNTLIRERNKGKLGEVMLCVAESGALGVCVCVCVCS